MEEKLTSFFRFEDLRVYDKSLEYYTWLTAQVKNADEFSRKSILMPFLDTAARISMNIADGSSNHKSEFVDYLKYAKSHVRQCVVYTAMALKNGVFTEEQSETSREMLMELTKMIGAMVVSFQRSLNQRYENHHREEKSIDSEFSTSDMEFNY
ncbi:MAG: four helix bundle protein [Bacteroidales bacterium]|nr:four helix bundle protein [Bacteroidales bacterium]